MLLSLFLLGIFLPRAGASSFLQQPGLRARGMGGAFTAVADDASAGLWNPAGLGQLEQSEVAAVAGQIAVGLDRDRLAYGFLSYVEPLPTGAVGISGSQFASELYKESTLVFSFSQELGSVYLGANVKGLFTSITENEYTVVDPLFQQRGLSQNQWSLDVGTLWRASRTLSVAVTAADLNRPNMALDPDTDAALPMTWRAGFYLWDHFSADLTYRTHKINSDPDWNFHVGTEWWLGQHVALRLGLNRDEISGGTSIVIPYGPNSVRLDYALQYPTPSAEHLDDTWGTHLFAVSMRFGGRRSMPREWGATDVTSSTQARMPDTVTRGTGPDFAEKLRKIQTGNADKGVYRQVAEVYRAEGSLEEAAAVYQQGAETYPDDLTLLYDLGRLYEQLYDLRGKIQWLAKAEQVYEQILSQDASYQDVTLRLIKIRIRQGKADKVIQGVTGQIP